MNTIDTNSKAQKKNRRVLNNFLSGIQVLPVFPALDIYAKEKARLRSLNTEITEDLNTECTENDKCWMLNDAAS